MARTKLKTADDVAHRFGVAVSTVNRWVRLGIIPFLRPTRRVVRFDLAAVERALAERSGEGARR